MTLNYRFLGLISHIGSFGNDFEVPLLPSDQCFGGLLPDFSFQLNRLFSPFKPEFNYLLVEVSLFSLEGEAGIDRTVP